MLRPTPNPRLSAARFEDYGAAMDNALICYGSEALEGHDFVIEHDAFGWGWGALRPVPVTGERTASRDAHRATVRERRIRMRERLRASLQPVAA